MVLQKDLLPRQSSSPVGCSGCHTYDINSGACSYVSAAMITFPTQASFQLVTRLRGVSLYLKPPSGWLTLHQLLPTPKLWGKLKDTHALKDLAYYAMSLLLSSYNLTTHAKHRADVLILLPVYFSWSGLHSIFSSKRFLLHLFTILLQNRNCTHAISLHIFKEKTLHSPLYTSVETTLFFLGTDVTYLESVSYHAYFISIFLHFQVPFSTAWLLHSSLISNFSAFSNPAAWLAEQFCHICSFHPSTILSPARLSPSFWKWYHKFRYHRKKKTHYIKWTSLFIIVISQ